jgi:type IV secretory pathway VirB2 component (pilin)
MKELLTNLANMIKVKTIVTLAVIAVFTILALRGTLDADKVMMVVTTVVAFYFGTQSEKK